CRANSGQALISCVDAAYSNDEDVERLRAVLRAASIFKPAKPSAPIGVPPPGPDPLQDKPAPITAADERDEDDIYCSFVASGIRRGDLAYSRAEQVPQQCRGMSVIREALEAAQRDRPAFPISGDETDKEIAR